MNILDYIKWYKLARKTVNNSNLIPERTDHDIIENCVSHDRLNISPAKDVKATGASDKPNIWFVIHDNGIAHIGLHFNSKRCVKRAKNILHFTCGVQKTSVMNILENLDDEWQTQLELRIKDYNPKQSPSYLTEWTQQSNRMDNDNLDKMFARIDKMFVVGKRKKEEQRSTLDKYYDEVPVLNIITRSFTLNEENFKKSISIAHELMGIFHHVKTDKKVKKAIQELIDKKLTQIANKNKLINLTAKFIAPEINDKRRSDIKLLESEIEILSQ